jgi:8-oxo-dGTP pyrophosphatase MutT (NUDIX family)
MIRILHAGNWSPAAVSQTWASNTRRLVPEVETAIETAWTTALARPGVHLFDGPMCRLESWHVTDDRLNLTLSKSSYKPFLGTNMAHPEFAERFGDDVMANPLGVSPALITADQKLLLGHRTQSVAYYPGRIHPFAGCMEPKDADPFAAVARELKEELSLESHDIRQIRCTGVAEDSDLRQRELIFAAETLLTHPQIQSRLDRVEHHAIFAIPASAQEIETALGTEQRLTPVAVGSLLLWGRLVFGQSWFEKMRQLHAS